MHHMPTKIVLATGLFPPAVGGHSKYAKALHEQFSSRGIESVVVAYSSLLSLPPGARHLVYFFKVLTASRGADAILAFDTWSTGFPAVIAGLLTRTPVGIRIGGDFLWESYIERGGAFLKLEDFYTTPREKTLKERIIFAGTKWLIHRSIPIFNSEWLAHIWERAYGLERGVWAYVENVFPEKKTATSYTARNFIGAGRGTRLKNIPMLERIFESLKGEYPDVTLDTRQLAFEEHQERLKNCYAVLLPSVSDVNPNTIIEGIIVGKPFICTTATGLSPVVRGVGMYRDPLDEEAWRQAIVELLDGTRYAEEQARIEALSYTRTWEDVTNDILSVFQKKG
jgi:glycosyltransferase involved in cell wall biosynthesis